MAKSMETIAKKEEAARKSLRSPGSSRLLQRTAIQSLTFVRRASQASNKPGSPNTIQSSLFAFAGKEDGDGDSSLEPSSPVGKESRVRAATSRALT